MNDDSTVRSPAPAARLAARLSREGELGMHLVLALVFMVVGAALFGAMAGVHGDPASGLDARLAHWLQGRGQPTLTLWLAAVSRVHESAPVLVATALLTLYLRRRRETAWMLTAATAVPGGMLLNWSLKLVFQRQRPAVSDYVLSLHSYSFPSGHTTAATLLYGVIALYLLSRTRGVVSRSAILAAAMACALTVAFSRLYLGAHYLSDVLAAFGVAVFWLALCASVVHIAVRRSRAARPACS